MDTAILVIGILVAMAFGAKFLYPQQKPGKKCQSCPAFKQCGGNRPRCARRNETI